MLEPTLMRALESDANGGGTDIRQIRTAKSFGYEWNKFPEMREEWERNFWGYMINRSPEFFKGRKVLDAGCGAGRHAYYAGVYGAEVWAVDLGGAVEAASRNLKDLKNIRVIQADIHDLPFDEESFDFIYSIGVLHHLPDPQAAFNGLLRYLKPGSEIQIYLYWKPEMKPVKRTLLWLVEMVRKVTTRLPHPVLYVLSYPLAAIAYLGFVLPYRLLSALGFNSIAAKLPMKQYAQYPFRVCVNDQFDRFSAPIENRYTRKEALGWFEQAKLENIRIAESFGWVVSGRKPLNKAG